MLFGEGLIQGLDITTITAMLGYSIDFTASRIKVCLNLHYNESKSFLYANGVKIYQFKVKDSEIQQYPLCLCIF